MYNWQNVGIWKLYLEIGNKFFVITFVRYLCYVNESNAVVTSENVGIDIEKFKYSYWTAPD